jgi:hypothetical protein
VIECDFQLGPDAGDRAAQFVCGVGDQPSLPLLGLAESGEHIVQCYGQAVHLVLGLRYRERAGAAGASDILGAATQFCDGPQSGPDHPPAGGREEEQQ